MSERVDDEWLKEAAAFESRPMQRPKVGAALHELIDARAYIAAKMAFSAADSGGAYGRAVVELERTWRRYLEHWYGNGNGIPGGE